MKRAHIAAVGAGLTTLYCSVAPQGLIWSFVKKWFPNRWIHSKYAILVWRATLARGTTRRISRRIEHSAVLSCVKKEQRSAVEALSNHVDRMFAAPTSYNIPPSHGKQRMTISPLWINEHRSLLEPRIGIRGVHAVSIATPMSRRELLPPTPLWDVEWPKGHYTSNTQDRMVMEH